jgi:hypothetical protein
MWGVVLLLVFAAMAAAGKLGPGRRRRAWSGSARG